MAYLGNKRYCICTRTDSLWKFFFFFLLFYYYSHHFYIGLVSLSKDRVNCNSISVTENIEIE